jgi:hypothetical protein
VDISPISAIRPVATVKPFPSAPDLTRVFEIEYLGHSAEDNYTPANRKAARGLEDEDDEIAADEVGDAGGQAGPVTHRKVSFFV